MTSSVGKFMEYYLEERRLILSPKPGLGCDMPETCLEASGPSATDGGLRAGGGIPAGYQG